MIADTMTAANKAMSNGTFSQFTFNQSLILAEVLACKLRTNCSIEEVLDQVDGDAELSEEAVEFLYLHDDEPQDALLGLILALILRCQSAKSSD
ncbi:MAG: hypothetical protein KME07_06520 [Pegethrix bostrychoides GSE-TBD4-15B]|jgi:hypothetical protein|uniref:Uncharacterized protein n=1 Tax=Pegethrix bostrychoides GSE-TBD4-15B TaxID=2839662 RepID=A0A951P940_9CYAN|nr:hypothetical protein [Pegethrix bostrychoides GSE-TBD4-15B]